MTATTTGEAIAFLEKLHGKHNDSIELRVKDSAGDWEKHFFPGDDLAKIAAEGERLSRRCDVYIGVGARDGKGGTRENTTSIGAVWADCDFKSGLTEADFRKKLAGLPPPSMAVHSGNGLHFYWILREAAGPEDFELIRRINKALVAILGADAGACDPARVLRLPGTLNHKKEYGTPRPVRLLETNGAAYNLSDFDLYIPAEAPQEKKKAGPVPEAIPEGERNATLTRIAGGMRYLGLSGAEMFPTLAEINKGRCPSPLTEKELRTIADGMERYPAGAVPSTVKKPSPEIVVLETMYPRTAEDLILDARPQPPRLIEGLLYLQNLLTIAGPPKAGKSWLALLLMLCLVSGRPFLGYLIPRKYRVLYLFAEGGEYPFKQRLERAIGYFPGLEDEDMQRFRLLWTAGRTKLDNPAVEDALLRWSEDSDVITIDPHSLLSG
jgi:hypothetical protein